jgi:preprotein translocase subunit SecB
MTDANDGLDGGADAETVTGQLAVHKIYVKDVSFEAPGSPKVFTEQWNPQVDVQLANQSQMLNDELYEVVLGVTATVRSGEKTVYLAEVRQAGIFFIKGFGQEHLGIILGTACPNILFPFAREAVSDLVTRGGFPQLLLAPVNFDMLYQQELERQRQGEPAATSQTH